MVNRTLLGLLAIYIIVGFILFRHEINWIFIFLLLFEIGMCFFIFQALIEPWRSGLLSNKDIAPLGFLALVIIFMFSSPLTVIKKPDGTVTYRSGEPIDQKDYTPGKGAFAWGAYWRGDIGYFHGDYHKQFYPWAYYLWKGFHTNEPKDS